MSVIISSVRKNSPAYKKGVRSGFSLNTINSHEINDVLDYQFYIKEEVLFLSVTTDEGKKRLLCVKKDENEDLGLDFETYLMDKQQRCKNGCIFCFIDQLPKGMRDTLYFKDDDSRLSFLFGNYITLTNLSQRDAERITEMHISPVNVSVQTMNPELRVKMMRNKNAGKSLKYLRQFAESGIKINAQLVLCPGVNDGKELERSLRELSELYPAVLSVAAVPVGLTKYREGLYPLEEYTKEQAAAVIDTIEAFSDGFFSKHGTRLAFAADEFYLKAERPIPGSEFYEDFPQIENGVGLWADLEQSFMSALGESTAAADTESRLSIATGTAAYPLIKKLADETCKRYNNIKINVFEIKNDFFGHSITVAGLVTGGDLINQLKGRELFGRLLIPSVMLRSEGDVFLDGISSEEAEKALSVKITAVPNDGYELLNWILDIN